MGTHLHTILFAQQHAFLHDGRVACVKTAGNVGRGNVGQNLGIHADGVGAKAFAQITVQINGRHCKAPFKISARYF
jgi:hypothetical protein